MLIPANATSPKQTRPGPRTSGLVRIILSFILCSILIFGLSSITFAEQMVTLLFVNGEKKGEVFVHRTESGDFLVRSEDLKDAGLSLPANTIIQVSGEPHISLRAMAGVSFTFDEKTLTLNIKADPSLFPMTFVDFAGQPLQNVYYPKESSLFLNYGVQYQAGDGFTFQSLNLSNEVGIRRGDYLFLADTLFTKDSGHGNFVRLHTSVIHDDREKLQRTTYGDLFASSGSLGSSVNMGGIGITKVFSMDPYLITYPTLNVVGQASLPSEVDIYVNGIKIRTERISPGEFQLRNFSAYGGAGVVELVVRDSFGREQRYRYPFYAADNILLKKGLHDFSYNIGFLREKFASESNRYSKPAVVAFHRYGLSDSLSIGFRGEATEDVVNAGPQATVGLWTFGVLNLSLSGSVGHGAGTATDVSYQYQTGRFNTRLFYQYFSKSYGLITADSPGFLRKYVAGADFGYTYPKFGSLSLDLSTQKTYEGTEKRIITFGYSKNIFGNVTLNSTFSRSWDTTAGYSNNIFVGLTYTPKTDLSISARHDSTNNSGTEAIQIQKNAPLGEGIGFSALVQRNYAPGQDDRFTIDPMLQFNGRYGILRGEANASQTGGTLAAQYQLNASGALVLLDGVASLTRPVTDSFAVVKVGDIKGVTVRSGGQDIGKTDSSGRVFITNLSSYNDDQIAINDKDIPIEYYFPTVKKLVSPSLRSGSCVGFMVKKIQPVTGTLAIRFNGELKPLEFYEAEVQVDGRKVAFPTGAGGEFYIDISQSEEFKKSTSSVENNCSSIANDTSAFLKPGRYQASVQYEGRRHSFTLTIPDTTDPIIDLGQVVFDATP
jgi:outer membrane usher protein